MLQVGNCNVRIGRSSLLLLVSPEESNFCFFAGGSWLSEDGDGGRLRLSVFDVVEVGVLGASPRNMGAFSRRA